MPALSLRRVSGRFRMPDAPLEGAPLVVAVHGGSYDSEYFDVAGYSLLNRAEANGIPIVAIDRPGYGEVPLLAAGEMTLAGQGRFLVKALADVWQLHGKGRVGIVLIGHSIGGAIALYAAANPGDVPLLGVAISGVGLRTPSEHRPMWESLPDLDLVSMPAEVKDFVMFGPPNSYDIRAPVCTRISDRRAPKAELIDIVSTWHDNVDDVLGAIEVPVHYRQAEFDKLWIVDQGEVDGFAAALRRSPKVDADMLRGTGHCLDFHHIGASFQLSQLSFALQCAVERVNS